MKCISLLSFFLCLVVLGADDDRTIFNPTLSTTFKIISDNFKLSYIDGTKLSGYVCSDYITIGDYSAYMNFGCMLPNVGPMSEQDISGILGFGFPPTDTKTKYTNVLQSIMQSNNNVNHVFTLVLDPQRERGELQIGGVDLMNHPVDVSQSIVTDIQHDCDHHHKCYFRHYRIAIEHVRVGRHRIFTANAHSRNRVTAVVDSGTTCIILPSKAGGERVYTDIYASFVDVMQHFNYAREQPSLFFGIGGKEIEVTYQDYMLMNSALHRGASVDGSLPPMCVLSLPHYPQLFVLGDIFLQNLVTVHNLTGSPSLLFIPKVSHDSPQSPPEVSRRVLSVSSNNMPFSSPSVTLSLRRRATSVSIRRLAAMVVQNTEISVVPLEAVKGIQYVSYISAGFPAQQNISVIVDTGSASLALM